MKYKPKHSTLAKIWERTGENAVSPVTPSNEWGAGGHLLVVQNGFLQGDNDRRVSWAEIVIPTPSLQLRAPLVRQTQITELGTSAILYIYIGIVHTPGGRENLAFKSVQINYCPSLTLQATHATRRGRHLSFPCPESSQRSSLRARGGHGRRS